MDCGPILTIYRRMTVSAQAGAFYIGSRDEATPHLGDQIPSNPHFWARIGNFKPKLVKY